MALPPCGASNVQVRLVFPVDTPVKPDPPGSVEALLRLFEAVARHRLDGVGGPLDERVDIDLLLEVVEDVVGDAAPVPTSGPTDADSQAQEVVRPDCLRDGPEAVVAGESAAEPRLEASGLEIDVVVHDEQVAGIDLEEAPRRGDRPARLIHVRLRLQERDAQIVEPRLGQLARELPSEGPAVAPRQLVDDEPADVVARALLVAAGVAPGWGEAVERRGALAPTQQSHGHLAFGCAGLARLAGVGFALRLCLALGCAFRR